MIGITWMSSRCNTTNHCTPPSPPGSTSPSPTARTLTAPVNTQMSGRMRHERDHYRFGAKRNDNIIKYKSPAPTS
jgi:hypothetical protein